MIESSIRQNGGRSSHVRIIGIIRSREVLRVDSSRCWVLRQGCSCKLTICSKLLRVRGSILRVVRSGRAELCQQRVNRQEWSEYQTQVVEAPPNPHYRTTPKSNSRLISPKFSIQHGPTTAAPKSNSKEIIALRNQRSRHHSNTLILMVVRRLGFHMHQLLLDCTTNQHNHKSKLCCVVPPLSKQVKTSPNTKATFPAQQMWLSRCCCHIDLKRRLRLRGLLNYRLNKHLSQKLNSLRK